MSRNYINLHHILYPHNNICRLATLLEQRPRNDSNELGIVRESAVGQVNDSTMDHYEQLTLNLDNSSGMMYDKLRVEPGQNNEEFPSSTT